jgi:ABC-type transport system involved in multi-copper enzyme maturation permease subunit
MTLLPVLLNVLPSSLADNISLYLPGNAGDSIFALTHDSTSLSPGAGLAVFAGWTALAVILAAYRLLRKDA